MRQLLPRYDGKPDLLGLYGIDEPYVRGGFVTSADGLAVLAGGSRRLSNAADRAVFRTLRAVCDVVLVGAGTTRAEDYGTIRLPPEGAQWRAARGMAPLPRVAVMTASGDVDERVFRGERPLVLHAGDGQPDPRAEAVRVGDVGDALDQLAGLGLRRVLCEGGPTLLSAVVAAGRLTELCLTTSPMLAGAGADLLADSLDQPLDLELTTLLEEDGVVISRYLVRPEVVPAEDRPAGV